MSAIQPTSRQPASRLTTRLRGASILSAAALATALAFAAPLPAQAFGAPESFAELAEKISPSVVNITTSPLVSGPAGGGPIAPEGSPFGDFFDQFNNPDGSPRRSEALLLMRWRRAHLTTAQASLNTCR